MASVPERGTTNEDVQLETFFPLAKNKADVNRASVVVQECHLETSLALLRHPNFEEEKMGHFPLVWSIWRTLSWQQVEMYNAKSSSNVEGSSFACVCQCGQLGASVVLKMRQM